MPSSGRPGPARTLKQRRPDAGADRCWPHFWSLWTTSARWRRRLQLSVFPQSPVEAGVQMNRPWIWCFVGRITMFSFSFLIVFRLNKEHVDCDMCYLSLWPDRTESNQTTDQTPHWTGQQSASPCTWPAFPAGHSKYFDKFFSMTYTFISHLSFKFGSWGYLMKLDFNWDDIASISPHISQL